jgi:hypothetical protein
MHTLSDRGKKAGGPEQAGYTIVANVGDQPSDLQGGHRRRGSSTRSVLPRALKNR